MYANFIDDSADVLEIAMRTLSLTSVFSGFSAICIEYWALPGNVEVSENVSHYEYNNGGAYLRLDDHVCG